MAIFFFTSLIGGSPILPSTFARMEELFEIVLPSFSEVDSFIEYQLDFLIHTRVFRRSSILKRCVFIDSPNLFIFDGV